MTQVKIMAAGDRALLIDLGDVTARELHAASESVKQAPGVVSCVVGHSSLYVVFRAEPVIDRGFLESGGRPPQSKAPRAPFVYRVSFAGAPDLDEFLTRARISLDEFVRRIRDVRLVARYIGFRGGFAYLDGWPEEWAMPRRPTSRPVKRGSFAIAGAVAAFYPLDTPGGWNILGKTNADLNIEPGDEIRIEPTLEKIEIPPQAAPQRLKIAGVEIEGPLAIITDNPFDIEAAQLANEAVGNPAEAPVIECAMVIPRIRTDRAIVWVGPDGIAGKVPSGKIEGGLRGYIAAGDAMAASRRTPGARTDRKTIHAIAGPHDVGIREIECEVTRELDRVGIRLRAISPIVLTGPADMKSVGMQCGTVQLHPDGSLMAMGPDHPVTGGYQQPMTVITSERWKLAQLSPGDRVRFVAHEP